MITAQWLARSLAPIQAPEAIVGYPSRTYLWVLSRRPKLSEQDYERLIQPPG